MSQKSWLCVMQEFVDACDPCTRPSRPINGLLLYQDGVIVLEGLSSHFLLIPRLGRVVFIPSTENLPEVWVVFGKLVC